jgi:hypothetical protein
MSRVWKELTGDSYRLWINDVSIETKTDPWRAVTYILKYVRKPPRFDSLEAAVAYYEALKGIRRIHTYGCFYARPEWRMPPQEFRCPFTGDRLICVGYACKGEILIDYYPASRLAENIRGPTVKAYGDLLLSWTRSQVECLKEVRSPLLKDKMFSLDKLPVLSV